MHSQPGNSWVYSDARKQMLVSGTGRTGSPLGEITSLGMNGSKALERSRLLMPTNVSEYNSFHFALADTAVKELLSIISCLSSSLLLHYPFLKSICSNFKIVNKVTLKGRKLCITLFLSLGKS